MPLSPLRVRLRSAEQVERGGSVAAAVDPGQDYCRYLTGGYICMIILLILKSVCKLGTL